MRRLAFVSLLWAALAFGHHGAWAQSLGFGGGDSGEPIEIEAENGIEWQQDEQIFLAHGNARATKGDVNVLADMLRAYYREKQGGGSDIWRLDAEGNVRIVSPGEKVTCQNAIYDVDKAVLVLKGGRVRLETKENLITADDQMEYWEKKQQAVARGNAFAVHDGKRLRADVLVARFKKTKTKRNKIYRVDAYDNIKIDTDSDKVRADRGVYDVERKVATLTGNVTLIRGDNVLKGCKAVVNMQTNVSKLFACKGPLGRGRVKGLLQPEKMDKIKGK